MLADRLGVSVAAVVLGAVGVAAAAAGGWWALRTPPGPDVAEILPSVHAVPIPTPAPAVAPEPVIVVHVDGAVARPGVHELPAGSRVADAIGAAGGLTGHADSARLNLAEPMIDGSRLWVPTVGEAREPSVVRATPAATPAGGDQIGATAVPVDINTADAAALQSLPGTASPASERDGPQRSGRLWVMGMLGAATVAAAFSHSLLHVAAPPLGWSQAAGARVFSDGAVLVLVLERAGSPERVLQSLREAGVRRVDLVVAAAGGAADARAVLALVERFPAAAVVAPPMHRVPRARTVSRGAVIRVGPAVVNVVADDPALVVEVEGSRDDGVLAHLSRDDGVLGHPSRDASSRAVAVLPVYSPAMQVLSVGPLVAADLRTSAGPVAWAGSGP